MPNKFIKTVLVLSLMALIILAAPTLCVSGKNDSGSSTVRVGALANKGKPTAIKSWQPLIDYLEEMIPEYEFVLVPLDYGELYPEVETGRIDFIIINTGQYIELESYYGVSRVATFRNAGPGGFYTKFGGVLFVRADRQDIQTIGDFPGHKVLVTDEKAFGGWLMQLREIKSQGINPAQFAKLESTGNHEEVVYSILEGDYDVGAIRTDTLERMAEEGKIDLSSIRIINEQHEPGFPFRHSTRLYPEWAFAKAAHTDSLLARDVAVALLTLPEDSPAAKASRSGGWTFPEDYNPAHELLRELKLSPYQHLGEFNALDVIKKYWQIVLLSVLLLLVAGVAAVWISIANRRLEIALVDLNTSHAELEKTNALLLESMQYARIIQESLLPAPQVPPGGAIDELEVLWEPLNLVSGDYYWVGQINNKTCIMVADCTGHGVPGALLTMLLSASLDSIFHEKELTDPGKILKEVDQTMRRKLRQDENNSTSDDGLEAAICTYDPNTRILQFAGAGLPLLWVKGENTHLIKEDRYLLGYRTLRPKGPLKVHELKVEPNMTFYMFTDGVTNLMGGESRQLFGRKRLAILITEISRLPLTEQIKAIKKHLQSYRQNEELRDDMTLVGFKLK